VIVPAVKHFSGPLAELLRRVVGAPDDPLHRRDPDRAPLGDQLVAVEPPALPIAPTTKTAIRDLHAASRDQAADRPVHGLAGASQVAGDRGLGDPAHGLIPGIRGEALVDAPIELADLLEPRR
jgi:hypothetical protein